MYDVIFSDSATIMNGLYLTEKRVILCTAALDHSKLSQAKNLKAWELCGGITLLDMDCLVTFLLLLL